MHTLWAGKKWRCAPFFASCLWVLLGLLASGCNRPQLHQQEAFVFGTQVELSIAEVPEAEARAAASAVLAEFDRLHRLLHAWQPSEITRLNDALAAGMAYAPPPEVLTYLADAQQIARAGEHLFDPGIGRLIALWGFQNDHFEARLPDAAALAAWRQHRPSMADLVMREGQVSSRNRQLAIDLGGYAKGVALDRAADILRARGIRNALINIGGNVMALGDKSGTPWKIGIRHPRGSGYLAALALHDGEAIGTSGDYQRYFELDGRRYAHLLDPRTGEPAQGTQAVTVLISPGPSPVSGAVGMRSDALSKPLFIAGADAWSPLAERLGVRSALRVDASGQIFVTEPLAKRLTWPPGSLAPHILSGPGGR